MKLITEVTEDLEILKEEKEGKRDYFIEGIFLQSETKNRNGRIYPERVMDKQVNKYTENYINQKRAFGELGHPDGPSINLDRVSHMITELRKDGTNYIGRAKIMDTPMGRIVKNLLDEGAKIGVSSRGLGSLKREGNENVVQDDFHLVTAADIVADPSAPEAFVEGIMENREWILDGGVFRAVDPQQVFEEVQEEINTAARSVDPRVLNEKKLEVFYKLLEKISKV